MLMDYEVFEPSNEHLARILVRILEERGYNAGYQLGYPNNKLFIKVDTKEEADRISGIIRGFMEKFRLIGSEVTTDEVNTSISMLSSLIPETKIEHKGYGTSRISESEIYHNVKLEEWKSKIVERLNLLNTLMAKTPDDPSNEKRKIESDTLVWVLQNMP